MHSTIDTRKAQLLARKAELSRRIAQIETELDSHHAADWTELATEREADEVLEGIGISAQAEVRMIDAALVRMEQGEYGACTRCGADIAAARLDLLPFTPFCQSCAASAG